MSTVIVRTKDLEYLVEDLTASTAPEVAKALNDMWAAGYALLTISRHQIWGTDRDRSFYIFKRKTGRPTVK